MLGYPRAIINGQWINVFNAWTSHLPWPRRLAASAFADAAVGSQHALVLESALRRRFLLGSMIPSDAMLLRRGWVTANCRHFKQADYQHFKEFSHAQVSAGRWGEASSSHQVIGSIWKLFVHFVVASRCIGGTVKPGSISTFGLRRNAPEIVWTCLDTLLFFHVFFPVAWIWDVG